MTAKEIRFGVKERYKQILTLLSMKITRLFLVAICLCATVSIYAQKKVTYGKSTFTLYNPIPTLAPLSILGIMPPVAGYTLKQKEYGPGTYYAYAPGNVPYTSTTYNCLLTEMQNWVFHRLQTVTGYMAQKGYKVVDEKTKAKIFKKTRILQPGTMYQISPDSWLAFNMTDLQNCGAKPWSSSEHFVGSVAFIERVPEDAALITDRLFRFWNDGAKLKGDQITVSQSNSKTNPTAPTDQNPNNFFIGETLNPEKGFFRLSFEDGAAKYVWHNYQQVVANNMVKPDFDAAGEIKYNNPLMAFRYLLESVKIGKEIYICYIVENTLLFDIEPGVTWQKNIADLKAAAASQKAELEKLHKANARAMENMYKEIFK